MTIGAFPASKEIENEDDDDDEDEDEDEDDWGGAVSKNPILDRPLSSDQYRQYQATLCQQSVIGVSKEA